MNKTFNRNKNLKLVQIALLTALVVVLQVFFSAIKLGPVTLSFVLVPIVIAGAIISPLAALFIGFISGVTTFIQVFTSADPFYIFLMTTNPVVTALICIVKTSLAGLFAGLVYKACKSKTFGSIISAIVCPVTNTGIFCLGMFLFFADALTTDATFGALASENIVYFILIGLAGINFLFELILNVIVCPIVLKALSSSKIFKK